MKRIRRTDEMGRIRSAYIEVQVGKLTMHETLFDTGSTTLFTLTEYSFRQLQIRFNPSEWGGKITDATIAAKPSSWAPPDSLWRVELPQWQLGQTAFTGVSSSPQQ